MKILSIIGIVLSLIGILTSIAVMNIGAGGYCVTDAKRDLGLISLFINGFFLAFCITSTVVSFRKKNVTA
jgi:hypothetical protein